MDITLLGSAEMRVWEMEDNKMVTHHFDEEDMSWKTAMR